MVRDLVQKEKELEKLFSLGTELEYSLEYINKDVQQKKKLLQKLKEDKRKAKTRNKTSASHLPVTYSRNTGSDTSIARPPNRRRIYTELENNNYFSSNEVINREKEWLNEMFDSKVIENKIIEKKKNFPGTIKKNIKLPSIHDEKIIITDPLA